MIPPDADLYDEALEEDEEGLAAERTDLAWGRSGLAVMACGVAIARGLPGVGRQDPRPVVGAVVLVMAGVVWMVAVYGSRKRQRAVGEWRPAAQLRDVGLIAIGTSAVGVAAIMLVLFLDT